MIFKGKFNEKKFWRIFHLAAAAVFTGILMFGVISRAHTGMETAVLLLVVFALTDRADKYI